MILDEIRDTLKRAEPDLDIITHYAKNAQLEKTLTQLEQISHAEDFWQHTKQTDILKELQRVKNSYIEYQSLLESFKDLKELTDLFASDEQELEKIYTETQIWAKHLRSFKINILLPNDQDRSNCFLSINAGAGGIESQDWAEMLLRMYTRFCDREHLKHDIVDYQQGEAAGIKSTTLYIKGKNAYGLLKSEQGIHRLIRISPFDTNKRRHTSFAAITVSPEMPKTHITINPDDLRIDTYRAGGAGGQHVNKTESAVRITHIPSGTVVQCQNERSQIKNREIAMKMLMARLVEKKKREEEAKKASIKKKKIEWGSQIRTYTLHPYKMTKDHRTGKESPQPDLVLDGELMDFIEAYLVAANN